MKQLPITLFIGLALITLPFKTLSALTLQDLADQVLTQSPHLKAQKSALQASEQRHARAQMHWAPRLGLNATALTTNDPGANLFGRIGQRSLVSTDFSPALINQPGFNGFQMVNLGLNLPLYEGGRRTHALSATEKEVKIQQLQLEATERAVMKDLIFDYGALVIVQGAEQKLIALKSTLQKILAQYRIGNSTNPVGYSGQLGLKGVLNRIEAALLGLEVEKKSAQISLNQKIGQPGQALIPSEASVTELISKNREYLDVPLNPSDLSLGDQISELKAEITEVSKKAEWARYLPQFGVFGQQGWINGSRNVANATTAGVYLQWSLFDPEHYSRLSEADAESKKESFLKDAFQETVSIQKQQINEQEHALEKTLHLLSENDQILAEQTKVASRLYQSGSITALQLSEVYNRRADFILNFKETEQRWIQVKSQKLLLLSEKVASHVHTP